MIFLKERELQEELADTDPTEWGSYLFSYSKREVSIGPCIPDFICVGYGSLPQNISWPRKWNNTFSFILTLFKKHGVLSIKNVVDYCLEDEKKVFEILQIFESCNLIERIDDSFYSICDCISNINAEVIAIEAKLSNWKEALSQGKKYKKFADKVIVAMDAEGFTGKSDVIDEFIIQGIGLCVLSKKKVEWIVKPQKNTPLDNFNKEFIVDSTLIPSRQILWNRR